MSIRNALSLSSLHVCLLASLAFGAGCAAPDPDAGGDDPDAEEEVTASAASALSAPVRDQDTPFNWVGQVGAGNAASVAQLFTAGITGPMPKVQLNVGGCYDYWGISCWFTLRVRTVTAAGIPGDVLAEARGFMPPATAAEGYHTWTDVQFANPANVQAGTRYALEIIADPGSGVYLSEAWGYAYPGGLMRRSDWDANTWYHWADQWNIIFVTWVSRVDVASPIADWGYGGRRWMADVTGDGKADYCRAVGDWSGPNSYLACSAGNADGTLSSNYPFYAHLADWGYDDRRWIVDFNGDGKADYCRAVGNGSGQGSYLACSFSTGNGLSAEYGFLSQVWDWGYSDRRWMADVSGDGKADYCRAVGNGSGQGSYLSCSLSTGSGLAAEYSTFTQIWDWGYSDRRWMADVSGDGKADYCRAVGNGSGQGSYLACSLSSGAGFGSEYETMLPIFDWGPGDRRWLADLSGDRRADLLRASSTDGGVFLSSSF